LESGIRNLESRDARTAQGSYGGRLYYEVPPEILDDPEALLSWAREAIRVGQESR